MADADGDLAAALAMSMDREDAAGEGAVDAACARIEAQPAAAAKCKEVLSKLLGNLVRPSPAGPVAARRLRPV